MTIADIKEIFKDKYVDIEIYKPYNNHNLSRFDMDSCYQLSHILPDRDYNDNMEVSFYQFFNEDDYNNEILANCDITVDFDDCYGNKAAKVLCIMVK